MERQLTADARHHHLDNNDNFSPDCQWLVFDTRDDVGGIAGCDTIGRVHVVTGELDVLHCETGGGSWGPGVGAASVNPVDGRVAFIRGLSSASAAQPYEWWRRTGVCVEPDSLSRELHFLDARDVIPPFTPGALRGGTHRHEWSGDGQWLGFTYNDALLAEIEEQTGRSVNLRTIGVATRLPDGQPVRVPTGPENHVGEFFAAIVVRVVPDPRPGSDEIKRAAEDAWVGSNGYRRTDGGWQKRARAFLGTLLTREGKEHTEVFIVDIPDRIDVPGDGPLEGTPLTMPAPPHGTSQRRLTFTEDWRYPGVVLEPRHGVRSSSDGTRIVFTARDDDGIIQAWLVSPNGGPVTCVTRATHSIEGYVRWSPDGRYLLYVENGAVVVCGAEPGTPEFGHATRLTAPTTESPTSPIWSPDGRWIAFNRIVPHAAGQAFMQIFLVEAP